MKYFCEHLSRLNCVSVSLEGDKISHFNCDSDILSATARGKITTVKLAAPVQTVHLEPESGVVSLRIPAASAPYQQHNWQFVVPWQAKDLTNKEISCRKCGQHLATLGVVKQLPSEYWAELMEFWHCHKPHTQNQSQKNYVMDPTPERALVADTFIRIHPKALATCEHTRSEKIWKWQIAVEHTTIEPHVFVAAMLRELINSHAIFTFLFSTDDRKLLVWVLNVEAAYTLTGHKPCTGLKVYFATSHIPELMDTKGEVETVEIPAAAIDQIEHELKLTNELLPTQNKMLGKWALGFLADA